MLPTARQSSPGERGDLWRDPGAVVRRVGAVGRQHGDLAPVAVRGRRRDGVDGLLRRAARAHELERARAEAWIGAVLGDGDRDARERERHPRADREVRRRDRDAELAGLGAAAEQREGHRAGW